MKVDELEKIINDAFEDKQNISDSSDKKILDAINETINLTDKGSIRVAEKKNGKWSVNQWVKKAILLSFRINKMTMSKGPYTTWYDKIPGKSVSWIEDDWKTAAENNIFVNLNENETGTLGQNFPTIGRSNDLLGALLGSSTKGKINNILESSSYVFLANINTIDNMEMDLFFSKEDARIYSV